MPKISKETAPTVEDSGPALDISGPVDDYTVDFVTIRQEHSLAELLKGLPGDSCPCPHWGYLFAGKITVTYAGPGRGPTRRATLSSCRRGTFPPPRRAPNSSSSAPPTSSGRARAHDRRRTGDARALSPMASRRNETFDIRHAVKSKEL